MIFRIMAVLICSIVFTTGLAAKSTSTMNEHVFLLHGLGRTPEIMAIMAADLERRGYIVHNIGYPSTAATIDVLAQDIFIKIQSIKQQFSIGKNIKIKLHFVGHSLGGILVRRILQQHQLDHMGRVVLLGPPNKGSEVAHFLVHSFLFAKKYREIWGPAAVELAEIPIPLTAPNYDCGIIAGNKHTLADAVFSWFLLPGPNDGKVTVASTDLVGVKAHIVLPVAHLDLPEDPQVIEQTAFFLAHGFFRLT